jgi:hypothetical protein
MSEKSPVTILPMRTDGAVNANDAGNAAWRGTFGVFEFRRTEA